MNKKDTKQLISEMQHLLGTNKNTLKETVYDSMEAPTPWEANNPGYDGNFGAYDEEEYIKQTQDPANAEVVQIINKIRQIALQGISKLANNPESPLYDTLKKVWQILDKTVETKEEPMKESRRRSLKKKLNEAGNIFGHNEDGTVFTNARDTWRNVEGSTFIWHGEWSDPEVYWQGNLYNAEDLDEYLWSIYKEDCQENGQEPTLDDFEDWVTPDKAECALMDCYPTETDV